MTNLFLPQYPRTLFHFPVEKILIGYHYYSRAGRGEIVEIPPKDE